MRKRCYCLGWQNRHWAKTVTGYNAGAVDPSIRPGSSGTFPDFLTFEIRGRGYYETDDTRWLKEIVFISPVLKLATFVYRFGISYERASRSSSTATATYFIIDCNTDGSFKTSAGSADNYWENSLGTTDTRYNAVSLWRGSAAADWTKISQKKPFIKSDAYAMMTGAKANDIYTKSLKTTGSAGSSVCFSFLSSEASWSSEPLQWTDATTDVQEIISRAQSLRGYKYWYGGDGSVANLSLANNLRNSYPGIWTTSYYNKAIKDINGTNRVGDCSYLVNYAYGEASPGNHGRGTSAYIGHFSKWSGQPRAGMIAWRNGHTGIILETGDNPLVAELVGIDYDYMERRYLGRSTPFTAVLYDPNRAY